MSAARVRLALPVSRRGPVLSWSRETVDRLAGEACRVAREMGIRLDETFVVGNGGNLLFDWSLWQVRPPTPADMVSLCRWAQGEAAVSGLFAPVMLKDVDQLLEPMVTYALLGRHCRKTIYHPQPTEPAHVKYLDRMARMMDGVPFSGFLFRGLAAGSRHDGRRTQAQELLDLAHERVLGATAAGRDVEPDRELGDELDEIVREAAAELNVPAPRLGEAE